MPKLAEVETFVSTHYCEVKNVRQLNFHIFNFFFQINLVEEVPGEYVLLSLAFLKSLTFFESLTVYKSLAVLKYFLAILSLQHILVFLLSIPGFQSGDALLALIAFHGGNILLANRG